MKQLLLLAFAFGLPFSWNSLPTFTPSSGLLSTIIQVDADGAHTCALTEQNRVVCWGYNGNGQLGDGTTHDSSTAIDVFGIEQGVTQISLGSRHSCALLVDGSVKCWGDGRDGQLGSGAWISSNTPVDVIGLPQKISSIDAGGAHTCALTNQGRVFCWGMNFSGQLGNGSNVGHSRPIEVVGLNDRITMLATGDLYTCALTIHDEVFCWGDNQFGQLGDSTKLNRSMPVKTANLKTKVLEIASGNSYTCAVLKNGGVKCWGANVFAQINTGIAYGESLTPVDIETNGKRIVDITVGFYHTCALSIDGAVQCWGHNVRSQVGNGWIETIIPNPSLVNGLTTGVQSISAGDNHTCALMRTHTVRCWGDNFYGQLGDATSGINDRYSPTKVVGLQNGVLKVMSGYNHTCALMEDLSIKCWGINYFSDTNNGATTIHAIPITIGGLKNEVSSLAIGNSHTCTLMLNHQVKCWGYSPSGQLGQGIISANLSPAKLQWLNHNVVAIASGIAHNCALMKIGSVKCWGLNASGQLGDGTTIDHTIPTNVVELDNQTMAIAAGYSTTCAITVRSSVMCWGSFLGKTLTTPTEISGFSDGAKMVAVGSDHICVLTLNGGVRCIGKNWRGQLGDGTEIDRNFPVTPLGLDSGVIAITAGEMFTCALMSSGEVACWGQNFYGQLGDGTTAHRVVPVYTLGLNDKVVGISAGRSHMCAVTQSGSAVCWGANGNGQLGWRQLYQPVNVVAAEPQS